MRIQPKEIFKGTSGPVETRFNRVINQYDQYINKLIRQSRMWQLAGLCSIIMILGTIIGWFHILRIQKEIPIVIEVNELGRAKYAGDISGKLYLQGYTVKDYMIESVLRDFISYTRDIYVDQEVMSQNYRQAASWCSNEIKAKLRDELVDEDPFAMVGRIKRSVSIESGIKITSNSWQYDWFDVTNDVYGKEISKLRYRGLFTVAIKEPQTENERFNNPLGIYIIDYNISKINEVLR
ncbi:MAG: type IV secretion system protein [Treponema sp.]|nr:type IV secretion system protein [Treponema sp.]